MNRRLLLAMLPTMILLAAATVLPTTAAAIRDAVIDRVAERYAAQVNRADLLPGATAARGPMTILMLGSDNFENNRGYQGITGQRSDAIIVLHVDRDFRHVSAISIQRDAYVNVPAAGPWHGGKTKINAALAYGGAPLAVRTVQGLLGVRIDHVMVVGFGAVHTATDAVGGVNVKIDKPVYDNQFHIHWPAGWNHLTGKQAEFYLRQRHGLPNGDFDRMKRHQQFLRALMYKGLSLGMRGDVIRLDQALSAVAKSTTVDRGMPVKNLAVAVAKLDVGAITYGSLHMKGAMTINHIQYQEVDPTAVAALARAIKSDNYAAYWRAYAPNAVTHGA
ncbi:LCP family protein [Fodinicola acaciae]|uniref:LCP family protein n=1 Tax=Fodinicola acaciae TaxID=2681555 RepID=UPI0013D829F2|nr:LCP family protein [Fodinicola acaciae]